MEDVNISKYRASVVREGSKPASPGFVVSEGQSPTDPAGSGQNHLPVTIATEATGLSITESQILSGAGTVAQYIRGDGSLADFPESSGGGSSVSYYLNGSVNQGTIGGVAYKELNKVPILGAGTDFTINANGYIASFLTDAGDPNLLEIPGGNWNFETYFSANNGGGSPTFYVELYKYNGTTFTLLASNSAIPELIAFGTNITAYFTTLAVPTTTLALTDRLAVRYYVTHSGRTITMHTEGPHLCQIITTFTTGLTALNGLTAQVQNFATGTTGTDFNIASATATHTFNLPTASATNRGALSSGDWTTFNNKQNALGYVPVPETRTITINGTTQDLSANRTYNVGTVTSVAALTLGTSGTDLSSTVANGTTTPVITLNVPTASATNRGALSAADWSTFNGKQNALTLTTTGSSGAATLVGSTLNIPNYSPDLSGYVPTTRTITINGTTQDLSANRTFNVGTVTSVGLSSATSGVTIGSTPVTTSGTITLTIATASGSQNGLLSSTDWTTFNSKQNALTNPVTGTGTTNYLAKFTGSTTVGNSQVFDNGTNVGIGTTSPSTKLEVTSSAFNVATFNSTFGQMAISFANNGTTFSQIGSGVSVCSTAAADDLGFGTAGLNKNIVFATGTGYLERMRITSSGNVLIGTTTDNGARLQVSGTATVSSNLTVGNGTSSVSLVINRGAAGDGNGLRFATTGTLNWYIGSAATSTNTDLEIYNHNTANTNLRFSYSTGAATFSSSVTANSLLVERAASRNMLGISSVSLPTSGDEEGVAVIKTNSNLWQLSTVGYAVDSKGVRFYNNGGAGYTAFEVAQAGGTRFIVNGVGNVGIGTTSPSGAAGLALAINGGASQTRIALKNSFTGDAAGDGFQILLDSGSADVAFEIRELGMMRFATDSTERMRITSGGNVLIGTTTDSGDKLRVNGTSFSNTIMTWNPENDNRSGIAWRLGGVSNASITPNRRLRVNVGGVEYYIGAVEV